MGNSKFYNYTLSRNGEPFFFAKKTFTFFKIFETQTLCIFPILFLLYHSGVAEKHADNYEEDYLTDLLGRWEKLEVIKMDKTSLFMWSNLSRSERMFHELGNARLTCSQGSFFIPFLKRSLPPLLDGRQYSKRSLSITNSKSNIDIARFSQLPPATLPSLRLPRFCQLCTKSSLLTEKSSKTKNHKHANVKGHEMHFSKVTIITEVAKSLMIITLKTLAVCWRVQWYGGS